MTKQNWLEIKKRGEYTLDSLYEYWKDNRKENYKNPSEQEFKEIIQVYIQRGGEFSYQKINQYFDEKFNITKIFDKDSKLIMEL
jgi:hypothetical protein